MRPPHLLRALIALCLATTALAAGAGIGEAAQSWPGNERTATPKSAERMLEYPVTLDTEACPAPFDATTRCGLATVPANWAKPDGRTLGIWFASIPAPSGRSTGVTVPFHGGPGEAISDFADLYLSLMPALPDRDMLLVDLRGNGRSGRLGCPTLDTAQWRPDGQAQVDANASCAQEVGPQRDDYTTVSSVLDVEAIRRALNLPKPSLLGTSYGTWPVQTYAALFPDLVQAAVIDGIIAFHHDPWGRMYTDGMQRVLRLRCERTNLCDPDEADAQVRAVAASLAAQPVLFPNSPRVLTEGTFTGVSAFAIQYAFADYLTAVDQAADGDFGPMLALIEAITPPPVTGSGGSALSVVVACNEYRAPFDLDHTIATRTAEFERGLAGLPDDAFGWFSKQGWVDSALEQVNMCLKYPKPLFSSKLLPPYDGPFPDLPMLMLNGDLDLQAPLAMAEQAKQDWPNSVLLTIKDSPHVTLRFNQCSVVTALTFLENPVLPDEHVCDNQP
jgi:pimeloyl-ACP methyl ester carboxylesterase